jgi:hypothetical protein
VLEEAEVSCRLVEPGKGVEEAVVSCRLVEPGKGVEEAEGNCRLTEPGKGEEEEEEHGDDALKVEGAGVEMQVVLGATVLEEHGLPDEEAGAGGLL